MWTGDNSDTGFTNSYKNCPWNNTVSNRTTEYNKMTLKFTTSKGPWNISI